MYFPIVALAMYGCESPEEPDPIWTLNLGYNVEGRAVAIDRDLWIAHAGLVDKYCKVTGKELYCIQYNICGDGLIDGTETCDDYNQVSGDSCSASCQSEKP